MRRLRFCLEALFSALFLRSSALIESDLRKSLSGRMGSLPTGASTGTFTARLQLLKAGPLFAVSGLSAGDPCTPPKGHHGIKYSHADIFVNG